MGGRRHILHDVIRKSETVTLTVGDKSASKTVVLEEPIDIYLEIDDNPYNSSVHDCSKHIESLRNSVVACNAAEVAHKIASTQQIGKHISKGFWDISLPVWICKYGRVLECGSRSCRITVSV